VFLHLGGDVVIPLSEVVAIFESELATESRAADEFLKTARDEGLLVDVSGGRPKAFVVTSDRVYLSQISSLTLKKRAENVAVYLQELSREA
jgi:regulator of extracellular matrix RemA (YlzA/DUF370 family)